MRAGVGVIASAHKVPVAGGNIGYRAFNGSSSDTAAVSLGNLASAGTTPGTWLWAGRVVVLAADAEIASTPAFDPLDFYAASGGQQFKFYNGAVDSPTGPGVNVGTDVIVALRLVSTSVAARWSIATYSGSWSAFTHTNTATYTNRAFPGSGSILFSPTGNPFNGRMALFAHSSSGALSDADIATLTTGLAAWTALPSITNVWRFDQTPIADLVGTSTQTALTGTSVTAAAFPLA